MCDHHDYRGDEYRITTLRVHAGGLEYDTGEGHGYANLCLVPWDRLQGIGDDDGVLWWDPPVCDDPACAVHDHAYVVLVDRRDADRVLALHRAWIEAQLGPLVVTVTGEPEGDRVDDYDAMDEDWPAPTVEDWHPEGE